MEAVTVNGLVKIFLDPLNLIVGCVVAGLTFLLLKFLVKKFPTLFT